MTSDCPKDAELEEKASQLKRQNYTLGAVINGRSFVINIDEGNHVIIYDGQTNVIGNGLWDPELQVIKDSQGDISEEEWDELDEAVCQSPFGQGHVRSQSD